MAEEGTNNQVESEKFEYEDDEEEACSIERITITKGPPKISSRYLSGPRGSCHDLCKLGIHHDATEVVKPWKAKKKVNSSNTRDRKIKVQEENVASSAAMKRSGSSSKPCPIPKLGVLDSPVDIKEVIDEKAVESEKNSPPVDETDASIDHNGSDIRQENQHSEPSLLQVKESSKNRTKSKTVKSKSAFGSSSIKETAGSIKQMRKSLTAEKEKSMPTHRVKKTSSLSGNKNTKDSKIVSSPKDHKNDEEAKHELAEKILHAIEPASTNLFEEPYDETKLSSTTCSPSGNKILKQTSKNTGNSGVSSSTRKGLRNAGQGTRSRVSVSPSSSWSSRSSPSIASSSSISSHGKQYGASASASKSNRTGNSSPGERVRVGGYKVKPRMSTIVGAASKVTQPRKLTFRRGKVIEIQPQINNIPRKLKFRPRPRSPLGDEIHRDINSARRMAIASKEDDVSESSISIGKPEKSVQRHQIGEGGHQDLKGKKVHPRLYNNVIEETASMLAELRKSKVKALVGAFETVISSSREASTPAEVSTSC